MANKYKYALRMYKGFQYACSSIEEEKRLIAYIDSLGENPTELPDVDEEHYDQWKSEYDFSGVEVLVLPDSIKRIGKCVFAQSKIQNLIADGVEHIDELAFYQTQQLNYVSLKQCRYLVAKDPETGEFTEFADCFNHSHVRKLDLPNVEVVGRYCFYDMPNIEVLSLPKAKSIAKHAIYGNEKLKGVLLGEVENTDISIITMNPSLEVIETPKLVNHNEYAFYGNKNNNPLTGKLFKAYKNEAKQSEKLSDEEFQEISTKENSKYEYEFRGVKFTLIPDLTDDERDSALDQICHSIELWTVLNEVPASPRINENESGHDCLKYIQDIYLPESIKSIGDYAFAKTYGLKTIVAPGVVEVKDHAFYCNSDLRYVDLEKCEKLEHDAFNGVAYNFADSEAEQFAKIFIPNVKEVGTHAFWQTGFRVIDMPECEKLDTAALEENEILKAIRVKKLNSDVELALINNSNLYIIEENNNKCKEQIDELE